MQQVIPVFTRPRRFAEIVDASEREVHRWLESGLIPSFKIGRSRFIETEKAIEALRRHAADGAMCGGAKRAPSFPRQNSNHKGEPNAK